MVGAAQGRHCPPCAPTISRVLDAAQRVHARLRRAVGDEPRTQNRENNPMQSRPGPFKAEFVAHESETPSFRSLNHVRRRAADAMKSFPLCGIADVAGFTAGSIQSRFNPWLR